MHFSTIKNQITKIFVNGNKYCFVLKRKGENIRVLYEWIDVDNTYNFKAF